MLLVCSFIKQKTEVGTYTDETYIENKDSTVDIKEY